MREHRPRTFTVTFRDVEDAENMVRSDFMSMGRTYPGRDPKVVILNPFPHVSDPDVKETLDELESVGALTYVQENP